jgi:putative iron-dependent peroxidase
VSRVVNGEPLLDYSRAVTGSLFFVPPAGFPEALPGS